MPIETFPPFVKPSRMADLIGVSETYIRKLRKQNEWIEGTHYVLTAAGARYNSAICLHWMATRTCPEVHQKAIQQYQEELLQGNLSLIIRIHQKYPDSLKEESEKSAA